MKAKIISEYRRCRWCHSLDAIKKFPFTLDYCKTIKNGYFNLICCKTGSNVPVKRAMLQQCCKTSCIEICSPFYGGLSRTFGSLKNYFCRWSMFQEHCLRSNTTVALYEGRSSLLYTLLLQLRKESLKKIQDCTGFEPLTSGAGLYQLS